MATQQGVAKETFAPILVALATMQGTGSRPQKLQAHEYLEGFQKSVRPSFRPSLTKANRSRLKHGLQRMGFYSRRTLL